MTKNTINHHPSEALLADYASGAMGAARSLVIAAHVHACPRCRALVETAEAAGGEMLEDLPAAEMGADALDAVLARLDTPAPQPAPTAKAEAPADWIRVPDEVAQAVSRKRWVAPGVWIAPVDTGRPGGPLSYLLRVGAGMRMPQHTHDGCELTIVLKGAFADGEQLFAAGDLAEADDDIEHSPHITGDGECVCLVSCDNRLIVKDWIGRVVATYAGI